MPISVPSAWNSTRATPTLSLAVASSRTLPPTTLPCTGEVSAAASGGVLSMYTTTAGEMVGMPSVP